VLQNQFIHAIQDVPLLDALSEIVVPATKFDISHASILFQHAFFLYISLAKSGRSTVAGIHPS